MVLKSASLLSIGYYCGWQCSTVFSEFKSLQLTELFSFRALVSAAANPTLISDASTWLAVCNTFNIAIFRGVPVAWSSSLFTNLPIKVLNKTCISEVMKGRYRAPYWNKLEIRSHDGCCRYKKVQLCSYQAVLQRRPQHCEWVWYWNLTLLASWLSQWHRSWCEARFVGLFLQLSHPPAICGHRMAVEWHKFLWYWCNPLFLLQTHQRESTFPSTMNLWPTLSSWHQFSMPNVLHEDCMIQHQSGQDIVHLPSLICYLIIHFPVNFGSIYRNLYQFLDVQVSCSFFKLFSKSSALVCPRNEEVKYLLQISCPTKFHLCVDLFSRQTMWFNLFLLCTATGQRLIVLHFAQD